MNSAAARRSARRLYVGGQRVQLDPSMVIGTGGEADVYDLGDGRALKLFKRPDHPHLAGLPAEQAAAQARLATHQHKLRAFPQNLPERVIAPRALVTSRKRGGDVLGYAMPLVPAAEMLYRYAEPRFRRNQVSGNHVVDVLCDLRDTVTALHATGVVIGDFNDLNVLVSNRRAYVIDADSFQYGAYMCSVFSERFVDPTLCDGSASAPVLIDRHRASSDWYAFTVMVMRSLLCVGPYGGVYRPRDASRRVAHASRPLHRITVFDADVTYPRPALHFSVLPDDLLDLLHATFVNDARAPFPAHLLDDLRWTRCVGCGMEHARALCPACQGKGKKPVFSRVRGNVTADEIACTRGLIAASSALGGEIRWLTWDGEKFADHAGRSLGELEPAPHRHVIAARDGALVIEHGRAVELSPSGPAVARIVDSCAGDPRGRASVAVNRRAVYWLQGGRLMRSGAVGGISGDVVIGGVLRGQTRMWVGDEFGFGFYRAGNLTVGFTFDADHAGIDDSVAMPRIRGAVIDAHAVISGDRVWLWWIEARSGKTIRRCAMIARSGELRASASCERGDHPWLRAARGACAVGPYLFVPTDAGIERVEATGDRLDVTRSFPDTAPFVDASSKLMIGKDGLYAAQQRQIWRLQIS